MNITAACTLVFALLLGCSSKPLPPPELPPGPERVTGDGIGTPVGDACAKMRALGCKEGFPNRRGMTCYEVQFVAAQSAPMPTKCIIEAETRIALRLCGDSSRELTYRCLPVE